MLMCLTHPLFRWLSLSCGERSQKLAVVLRRRERLREELLHVALVVLADQLQSGSSQDRFLLRVVEYLYLD